ncbi:hypothetical protein GJ496_011290 [Pomphorhynchus laevis]|nr:hypothetical protein GJ496_011290 [Pomphorhynchus laevis]
MKNIYLCKDSKDRKLKASNRQNICGTNWHYFNSSYGGVNRIKVASYRTESMDEFHCDTDSKNLKQLTVQFLDTIHKTKALQIVLTLFVVNFTIACFGLTLFMIRLNRDWHELDTETNYLNLTSKTYGSISKEDKSNKIQHTIVNHIGEVIAGIGTLGAIMCFLYFYELYLKLLKQEQIHSIKNTKSIAMPNPRLATL